MQSPVKLFLAPLTFAFKSGIHTIFSMVRIRTCSPTPVTVIDSAVLARNLRVFISYSWSPETDKAWVHQLAEALRRRDINVVMDHTHLKPGDETTYFMESQISTCDVTLLVCTESYTAKANERRPGGVGFESILGSAEYMNSSPSDRARHWCSGTAACRYSRSAW